MTSNHAIYVAQVIESVGYKSGPGGASTPIPGLTTLRGEWLMTDIMPYPGISAKGSSFTAIGRP